MTKKFLNFIKHLGIASGVLIAVISCEKDFKNVGVNIVDNNLFATDKYEVANIIAYSQNITKNRTDRLSRYLLGTYQDANFGTLNASIATQLKLPSPNPDFGTNAVIDSVLLNIPLDATLDGKIEVSDPNNPDETIQVPNYDLDSIWKSGNNSFRLKIFELGTFLNNLDPLDPSKPKQYYSDETFDKLDELYNDIIQPNDSDTLLVITRKKYLNDNLNPNERVIYKYDTIATDKKPSIRIPFDNDTFKTRFQDVSGSSFFASTESFQHYFRGLYLEASLIAGGTSLIEIPINKATFTIYYSETSFEDEDTNEDLDGNGITGESNVAIGKAKYFQFALGNNIVNIFDRQYTGTPVENYLTNPNTTQGADKLYISGAAGSDAVIHLFGEDANANDIPDELETLQTKDWLINDAKLYLYVNPSNTNNPLPGKLYLYAIDSDGNKVQTYDTVTLGYQMVGGELVKDDNNQPKYYLFHITNYISKIINEDPSVAITDFGVKTIDAKDQLERTTYAALDTIMKEYNSNHKNVVINGNLPVNATDRIKLEIYYSEKNN